MNALRFPYWYTSRYQGSFKTYSCAVNFWSLWGKYGWAMPPYFPQLENELLSPAQDSRSITKHYND